jgi:hypothetical protein
MTALLLLLVASPVLSAPLKEIKSFPGGSPNPNGKGKSHTVLQRGPRGVPTIVEGQLGRLSLDFFDRSDDL